MRDALRYTAPYPAEAVLTLITDMLRAIAEYSKNDRAEFIRTVQETQAAQQAADISKKRKRLAAAQKRAGELEKLICKIYEDNALGKLPDARYEPWTHSMPKSRDASQCGNHGTGKGRYRL